MTSTLSRFIASGVFSIAAASANAAVIDFDTVGSGLSVFTSYTQAGFTVTAITGSWRVSDTYGNPEPSVFSFSQLGTLEVTSGAGTFFLEGLDFSSGSVSPTVSAALNITGFLGASPIFVLATAAPGGPGNSFVTVASPSSALIDRLMIELVSSPSGNSYNVDNIRVTAQTQSVPEPASLALLAGGALAIARLRRGRRER